jgi:ribosomal protein L11 methyltransferase
VKDHLYPYVRVEVASEETEQAGALLFELGADGIEQRDETTLLPGTAGKVTLVASFDRGEDAQSALAELPAAWSPQTGEVVGDAWLDEWKQYFEPFLICEGVVVRPPWREHVERAGERVIVLEPGRAFGTGLHETTSLVAEVLADRAAVFFGTYILDVGCGSGILSLVGLALGAGAARAVDVDPDSIAVTRENAERNGLAERVHADQTPVSDLGEVYPMVVANIEAQTLVELAPLLGARVAPGGTLVLSGILAPDVAPSQLEDVRRAYPGMALSEVRRKGEWIALVMR